MYDPLRNEVIVTYLPDGRSIAKSVSGGSWVVMDVDSSGELMRLVIRMATRACSVENLEHLHGSPKDGEKLHTIPEVAQRLAVPSYALRREILEGGMPTIKNGAAWQVRDSIVALCREIFEARRYLPVRQHPD